jgi:GAF domain-containing protein
MSQRSVVQRLIAFLKRPEALDGTRQGPARPSHDDFAPREINALAASSPDGYDSRREPPGRGAIAVRAPSPGSSPGAFRDRVPPPLRPLRRDDYPREQRPTASPPRLHDAARAQPALSVQAGQPRQPGYASRLDALVMRALLQFGARFGFVIRYDDGGRMCYVTGRDLGGRYVEHTAIVPDRRALAHTLRSGEANLFVQQRGDSTGAVLCGPVRVNGEVVGALYLAAPAQTRLCRGIFEIFCDQIARLLADEAA